MADILGQLSELWGISERDLTGHSKQDNLGQARKAAIGVLYVAGLDVGQIGKAMNRDHSTIAYYLREMGYRR